MGIDQSRQFPYDRFKREIVWKVQRIGLTVFIVREGLDEQEVTNASCRK